MERQKKLILQKIFLLVISVVILSALLVATAVFQKVEFADEGLAAAVREKLGNPRKSITRTDLLQLSRLDASGRNIARLDGIENLRHLVVLNLADNLVADLTPLRTLRKLRELDLEHNGINSLKAINFDALSGLHLRNLNLGHNNISSSQSTPDSLSDIFLLSQWTSLEELKLRNNRIEDITPLKNLVDLRVLDLRENKLTDISSLAGLTELTELNLRHNYFADLKALSGLTGLVYLNLHSNSHIRSLKPMERLTGLKTLILAHVPVGDDIRVLKNFVHLNRLNMLNCRLSHVTPLSALVNLQSLNLRWNQLTDISPLSGLIGLWRLNLEGNDIADLAPLAGLTELLQLNIYSNSHVRSIRPLERLAGLETLIMRNVPVGDDIRVLGDMIRLKRLNLRDCDITDIAPLSSMSNLRALDLRGNHLTDLSPLAGLTKLKELDLRDNDVADLTPLADLTKLVYLNIHSNSRVGSILSLDSLTSLETLIMRNVPVGGDTRALKKMTRLKTLNVRNCGLTDTSVLGALMAAGVLQDDPEAGIKATVNILENPLPRGEIDPYLLIRRYWRNISYCWPIDLPYDTGLVDPPSFSRPAGFYDGSFELELTSPDPGATIYYTLDSSLPTEESTAYIGSIRIQNPEGAVFSGTVVRAQAVAKDGKLSKVVTRTYFIDPAKANRYTLPVISLVTDKHNLFDPETGIYTNYKLRGYSSERPVSIEYFEPDGTSGCAVNAGVRIHGGASRRKKRKSLRLYARPEYDSNDSVKYQFFPGLTKTGSNEPLDEFKTLLLRNSGNDNRRTIFRDVLMQKLVEHSPNLETQATRFVVVFINGWYWGVYNLREYYDEHYFAMNCNVSPEDVVILELNAKLKKGKAGDEKHYLAMRDYAESHDLSDPAHYRHITDLMDVRNYIEYYAANIYFHNTDWPHNNIFFWRIKPGINAPPATSVRDGRWRWMIQGTDYGFACKPPAERLNNRWFLREFKRKYGTVKGPAANTLKWTILRLNGRALEEWPNILFRNLLENEKFKIGFINHLADQMNSSFHPKRVLEMIDSIQKILEPEMEAHCRRWRDIRNLEAWRKNVEVLRWFARERPEHLRKHVVDHFGLSGTARVILRTEIEKGHIRINRLEISKETPGIENPDFWTGIYFKGIPLRIKAVPEPGYRFASWEGVDQDEAEIELVLEGDITLTARFVRE